MESVVDNMTSNPLSCKRDKGTIGSFTSIVSYALQVEGEAEGGDEGIINSPSILFPRVRRHSLKG